MRLRSEDIVGYPVCVETESIVVNCVTNWIHANERACRYFACLNPHTVELAAKDEIFHKSLLCADFLTADGIGIVYASRILGGALDRRMTGMDVFTSVNDAMNRDGNGSCFFLGSTEETLQKIEKKMAHRYPRVKVVGTFSPPFKKEFSTSDVGQMIDTINKSSPDVLWVGLTAPKQEKWIYEHRAQLKVNFAGPIGAVFDFFVGNINRAGPAMQNMGLEWLPRLIQEPRRLWRRTLVSGPRFLVRTFHYRAKRSC